MRSNPLPVIVPCHRVLAAGGRLGGFAGSLDATGSALTTKRRLLAMEGAIASSERGERLQLSRSEAR
jgi:O6-methylguanine-DNA--protein-cysteine methyltransferase